MTLGGIPTWHGMPNNRLGFEREADIATVTYPVSLDILAYGGVKG